jgi:hypothetical protein
MNDPLPPLSDGPLQFFSAGCIMLHRVALPAGINQSNVFNQRANDDKSGHKRTDRNGESLEKFPAR